MSIVCLSNKTVDTDLGYELQVHLLATGKEFGQDVKVRVDRSSGIDDLDSDMKRRGVAVVETEAIEEICKLFSILNHVLPQPGVVFGTLSVSKLDAIAPYDHFSSQVSFGGIFCEIAQGIGGPHPTIVGKRQGFLWVLPGGLVVR